MAGKQFIVILASEHLLMPRTMDIIFVNIMAVISAQVSGAAATL